jgi:hypothetical protein
LGLKVLFLNEIEKITLPSSRRDGGFSLFSKLIFCSASQISYFCSLLFLKTKTPLRLKAVYIKELQHFFNSLIGYMAIMVF